MRGMIKAKQGALFKEEKQALEAGKPVKSSNRLAMCRLRLDAEGLLRAEARLRNAPHLGTEGRAPVLLEPCGDCARLLVGKIHEET